jgi:hypothetical protein
MFTSIFERCLNPSPVLCTWINEAHCHLFLKGTELQSQWSLFWWIRAGTTCKMPFVMIDHDFHFRGAE